MNDRQIENLLRMAGEAERLEAGEPRTGLRLNGWWLGGGLAAAAAIGLAVVLSTGKHKADPIIAKGRTPPILVPDTDGKIQPVDFEPE